MSHLEEGQLHELLDGELDESARAAALSHLATCERCRAAYEEAKSFLAESDALIDAVQVPAVPVVLAAAAAPAQAPPAPVADVREIASAGRLRRYRTLAWAASVMLAVGLGWYGNSLSRQPEMAATEAVATDAVAKQQAPAPAAPAVAEPTASMQMADAAKESAAAPKQEPAALPRQLPEAAAKKAQPADEKLDDQSLGAAAADREVPATPSANQAPVPAPAAAFAPLAAERRRENQSGSGVRLSAAKPAVSAPALTPISMEEAVRILGGSIRLIDGLTPTRMQGGSDRVRVVYEDPPGRELWLDQSRSLVQGYVAEADGRATALLPGDTTAVDGTGGRRSLVWMDQSGFQLALTGFLPADSLRQLVRRVQ